MRWVCQTNKTERERERGVCHTNKTERDRERERERERERDMTTHAIATHKNVNCSSNNRVPVTTVVPVQQHTTTTDIRCQHARDTCLSSQPTIITILALAVVHFVT